jgi:lipopolysaccharide transport system permease protein
MQFVSPVGYTTAGLVPANWRWLFELNPIVAPIEGLRWALIPGASAPSAAVVGQSVAVTLLLLVAGALFFARTERTVVDRV